MYLTGGFIRSKAQDYKNTRPFKYDILLTMNHYNVCVKYATFNSFRIKTLPQLKSAVAQY